MSLLRFVLLFLACNVGGSAGDGTTQGTCPNPNEVCEADGTCSGTFYFSKHRHNDIYYSYCLFSNSFI